MMMFMEKPQPAFLFFVVLLYHSCFLPLSMSSSNYTDQSALLDIKSKLTFDPTNTVLGGNWTTKTSFCNWIGVSCSKHRQRVTALDLSFMGLQGTISPHIGNLSFLVSLQLRNNSLTGFMPQDISRLSRLRILILMCNQLEGNIPPTLHHCQKLEILALAANRLSGLIPEELGFLPRLQKLQLTANNLTGSFPSTLFNLSSLVYIHLTENNNIFGSLPMDLCNYWPNIHTIALSVTKFSGLIPSRIYQCTRLVVLALSYNRFVGHIPEEIGSLQNLEELYLGGNSLTGHIPRTIGNISNLKMFAVEMNNLTGSIPHDLRRLSSLTILSFAHNGLKGKLPPEIFNISSLQVIQGGYNLLSGTFPSFSGGVWGPNVERLLLSHNQITGNIPSYFSNFSKLFILDCSDNSLYGPVPISLGNLNRLQVLILRGNFLTGEHGVPKLGFLSSLFNSSSLDLLDLGMNPLNGIIPESFGNISSSLQKFSAQLCKIQGPIPRTWGSLFKNLTSLSLAGNNISGTIPPSIGGLENMRRLNLMDNIIEGLIPDELCRMSKLYALLLYNNTISGVIPSCIGNLSQLQKVFLFSNKLTSSIPVNLWNLEGLLFLNLSFNYLNGYLPTSMRSSKVVQSIDLSWNRITGNIPSIFGSLESLNSLSLSNNLITGFIPQSLGDLKGMEFLELSNNMLSGPIPKSLETLKFLQFLNVSFNQLSGEIPSTGPFVNFTNQSFLGNRALCGRQIHFGIQPCKTHSTQKAKTTFHVLKYLLPTLASTMILIALAYMAATYRRRNTAIPSLVQQLTTTTEHMIISYQELRRATTDFCESNKLGGGSFSSVYKGILSNGTTVAVKVLNLQMAGAFNSFDAECKAWKTIRHRNLVKVITTCSSPEVRALVLQYMSNGSLEKWLYSHNYCLTFLQRVNFLVDIASALEYLHHGQSEVVVHCDLKPSNILLDEDMVAHVGDFGLAKVLANNKETTQTKTLGTFGYIAPEYGSAGKVSTKGDVFSYGIMLLEIISRKKPTDEMFSGEFSLRQWINVSLPENVAEVVDAGLLMSIEEGRASREMHALKDIILSVIEIGLKCSEQVPDDRMEMKDVVPKLLKIKLALENTNIGL